MDYFGRKGRQILLKFQDLFQSFWVNGLLWKGRWFESSRVFIIVSILLGQWITLEVEACVALGLCLLCFNPSGSMDYFGSDIMEWRRIYGSDVSILLGQWITLEAVGTANSLIH